jgi:hypothetical protein
MIINMNSAAVADHNQGRVEFSDLIEQEIFDDESDEVALVILDVLFALEDLRELLAEHCHP